MNFLRKNLVPVTFISLVALILVAPLALVFGLSAFIKNNSTFANKDIRGNLSQIPPTQNPVNNPSPVAPENTSKNDGSNKQQPTNKLTNTSNNEENQEQNPTPPPPPPAPLPQPPPASMPSDIEFIGTVTAVNGNLITFSYGSAQTVTVTVTETSPSSLAVGTRAHVHAVLKNGVYYEDEIEII